MRESEVEAYLKKKVELAGGECIKFTSPGLRGVPDRICILPNVELRESRKGERGFPMMGYEEGAKTCIFPTVGGAAIVVFVEVKSPSGELRPDQIAMQKRLRRKGAYCECVHNYEEVDSLVYYYSRGIHDKESGDYRIQTV